MRPPWPPSWRRATRALQSQFTFSTLTPCLTLTYINTCIINYRYMYSKSLWFQWDHFKESPDSSPCTCSYSTLKTYACIIAHPHTVHVCAFSGSIVVYFCLFVIVASSPGSWLSRWRRMFFWRSNFRLLLQTTSSRCVYVSECVSVSEQMVSFYYYTFTVWAISLMNEWVSVKVSCVHVCGCAQNVCMILFR